MTKIEKTHKNLLNDREEISFKNRLENLLSGHLRY
jgi:hypothetical protein